MSRTVGVLMSALTVEGRESLPLRRGSSRFQHYVRFGQRGRVLGSSRTAEHRRRQRRPVAVGAEVGAAPPTRTAPTATSSPKGVGPESIYAKLKSSAITAYRAWAESARRPMP